MSIVDLQNLFGPQPREQSPEEHREALLASLEYTQKLWSGDDEDAQVVNRIINVLRDFIEEAYQKTREHRPDEVSLSRAVGDGYTNVQSALMKFVQEMQDLGGIRVNAVCEPGTYDRLWREHTAALNSIQARYDEQDRKLREAKNDSSGIGNMPMMPGGNAA